MFIVKSFYVVVHPDGYQYPVMHLGQKYENISSVFIRNLSNANNIQLLLSKIRGLTPSGESIKLEAEDKCELLIKLDITYVSGYFNEFEAFEIPTSELIKLIEEWYDFLKYYEEGKIPGIIPKGKEDELIIVPRSMVKDEYWMNHE
jgi:hypothetical protein